MMMIRPGSVRAAGILALLLSGLPTLAAGQPATGRVALSATIASGRFAHGLSQTNGDAALRIAADYSHASGFFAGGFVGNVEYDFESSFRRPRDLQISYYAGYQIQSDDWNVSTTLSRYRYPDLVRSYDYNVLAFSAVYRDRYYISTAYSDHWLGVGSDGYSYEAGITQPLSWNLEFGASLGRLNVDRFLGGSFTYWDAGVSKVVDRFALDLRYHEATLDRATLVGSPGGDRWVLSVTYALLPR